MPRKFFKRYMPDTKRLKEHKYLRIFGELLHEENLWHLNRISVARAFAVGLFCAFMPIPFQMVLAAAIAIGLRANLPISVGLVWITNPITIPPMFYFAYRVGTYALQIPQQAFHIDLSWQWLTYKIGFIWEPLIVGCLICGVISAILGFSIIHILWRIRVRQAWLARKRRRNNNNGIINDKMGSSL